jgi:hypothetical protein
MRGLEIRRYMADVLSIVPFIVACIGLAVFDSKAFLWILGIYGLYLFKWTWGLGYVWADAVLYGAGLERTLSSFTPAGDRGTIRFPAGLWHCLVRLGWVPALLIVLGIVVGIFGGHSGGDNNQTGTATAADTATAPQEPSEPESADPKERAKARSAREIVAAKKFLQNARDIVVPVDPQTLLMKKENVNRTDMSFYSVYANAEQLPAETSYQLATGPQMLAMFLKTKGHDVDFLMIKGPNLPLSRWQAAKIAAEWPAADPPNTAVLQR